MSRKTNAEMLVETLAELRNEQSDSQIAHLRLQLLDRVKQYVNEFRTESTDQPEFLE